MPASEKRQDTGFPGGLPAILGPAMALGGIVAVLALLTGLFDWPLMAAVGVGAAVVVLALLLIYRQLGERAAAARALQNAEARVGGIVDSAMDAIVAVDESQRIVLYNPAAEKVFRRPRGAVLGQPLDMLIPERLRAEHRHHVERFGKTGVTSRRMGDQTLLVGLRANGEEFPIEASISQHSEDGRKLFTVILRDVTARAKAQEALQRSREELRELAQAANSVREQEKSRIARELHDELAQALTALKMDVNWIAERLHGRAEAVEEKLAGMQAMLDDTVAATRRISADLRPLMLDDLGLVPAAEWLVQGFTERSGIHCDVALTVPDELALQEPHASAIFRILQESLTNVARHAQASRVEVTLRRADGAVELKVRDNGRGFSAGDPRKPNSFGLMGLRERAYALGGTVNIDSRPGQGTKIEVRIPLARQAALP